ncbi:MAG: glycerol kinase GlpK [Ignisphaera sp.]|uniref:Glycerol kinase n=1 Tax=Ignisphaera aggregans TaxID=334771 RepID=A0A7C4JMA3_9CREN
MFENKFILAIDQGTTGTRAILFTYEGLPTEKGIAYVEHEQIYPKPGWVEHNPIEIWENTKYVVRKVLEQSRVSPKNIAIIGVTNQRETTVIWDPKTGSPLYNAIVWQDRRTAPLTDYLKKNYLEVIKEKTGLVPDPYFSSTKIWWLLDNVPKIKEKAVKGEALVGTIDSWLIWNLTRGSRDTLTPERGGAHIIDYSNASRTMLFNIHILDWDEELLEIHGRIPRNIMPLPRPSSDKDIYGYTGPEVSSELFNGVAIPIAGDAGDQQAALFGQAGFGVGDTKCTYGTGNFVLMNTGSTPIYSKHGLLTTIFYSIELRKAVYALEGSIFITGAAINWLRDGLKIIEVPGEVEPLAEAASSTGGVYFVPAFTGLGAPYWDPYARGLVIGITRGTERRHIARAVLESIAYLTRDVLEAMKVDAGVEIEVLKVDGGLSRSNLLMQFQADILGIKVVKPLVLETTSLGVAYLAGLAIGFWRNLDEIKKNWRAEKVFEPRMDLNTREKLYSGWKTAVRRALEWAKEVPWAYGY